MSPPLRIGMVCFASVGGSGTIAVELTHRLARRGHALTLLSEARPARLGAAIPVRAIEPIRHALFSESPYGLALASAIVRAAREDALDVVHLHYAVPHASSAWLARQTLGAASPALVVTLHGTDVLTLGAPDAHGPVIGAALRALDATTTPSRYLRSAAMAAYGVAPEVVPNMVDAGVFRPEAARPASLIEAFGPPGADTLTLVHVSSFRPVKASRALVPMLRSLRETVPGLRLVLVGDGPERAAVEADLRAAGLAERVYFTGALEDPAAVAGWVAASDLFVLASETESFGLAALEALACGVPVVARRVGGVPEVVRHGVTGTLVDAPGELAPAVAALASAPETRRAMSTAAVADARTRFSPEALVDAYETVYRRAIGARRAAKGGKLDA